MYKLSVEQHFDAAHALRGYKGKCENLHGHRFHVQAKVTATQLDDIGLAFDFTELKRILNSILSRFDHTNLSETPPFDNINPSSENIARIVYEAMKTELKDAPVKLSGVKVWESPENAVEYREG
jgi:6-pyruvoyltetrahydropterin/6-carboxytetrahydropterin synthase